MLIKKDLEDRLRTSEDKILKMRQELDKFSQENSELLQNKQQSS